MCHPKDFREIIKPRRKLRDDLSEILRRLRINVCETPSKESIAGIIILNDWVQ